MMLRFLFYICVVPLLLGLVACEPVPPVSSQLATSLTVPPAVQSSSSQDSSVDYVVIQKKAHILSLWKNGRPVKTYPVLAMGANPIGHKVYEGDERTPEGQYYIEGKHPSQNFQKFLKIFLSKR